MKKDFNILTILCLGVFCVVLTLSLTRRQVVATEGDKTITQQVGELLSSYVGENKQYTKLTTLHYSLDASNYHAGANNAQRRTYYDEQANALLMGDYDGKFEHINSGYARKVDDMVHYRNNAEEIALDNLFTARNENWSVKNSNPIAYFDVLSEIATLVSDLADQTRWDSKLGVYSYKNNSGLTISGDTYSDGLLKMLQYFAAPMLLINNDVKLGQALFFEADATIGEAREKVLVIKLLGTDDSLISTAYVVNHLTMEEVSVDMLKLDVNEWDQEDVNERFSAFYFSGDYNVWLSMTLSSEENIFETELVAGAEKVIFCRMNGEYAYNSWTDVWGQTDDLLMSNNDGSPYLVINYIRWNKYLGGWNLSISHDYVVQDEMHGWDNLTNCTLYYSNDNPNLLFGYTYFASNDKSWIRIMEYGNAEVGYPSKNTAVQINGVGNYYITFNTDTKEIKGQWSFND